MAEIFKDNRYEPLWKTHQSNLESKFGEIKRIGIGLLLVDIRTSKLYTVRELKNKPTTGVQESVISFPLETRKLQLFNTSPSEHRSIDEVRQRGEFIMHNLFGVLGEETPALMLGERIVWLQRTENNELSSYLGRTELKKNAEPDMVLVGLQNKREDRFFTDVLSDEVSPHGWFSVEELLAMDPNNLRTGIRPILSRIHMCNVIPRFLEKVKEPNAPVIRLIPRGNPISDYARNRHRFPDIGSI